MRKSNLFYLLFLLFSQNTVALQSVPIGDNQTKGITISSNELSRIFVKDDRIQNVRGLEGAYLLTKDTIQGQVYVKPTTPYQNKPFNLFVTTEKGRNFNLMVKATSSIGQDIELKPTTPSLEPWEKNSDYSQVLVRLIGGMINNEAPSGYTIVYPPKKLKAIKYDNFTVALQKKYLGRQLSGEVLVITNRCNERINLTEALFYHPLTRAVTIIDPAIPARGQTMVFRVESNE